MDVKVGGSKVTQGRAAVVEVVAAVLTHRNRVALFRRSRKVRGDVGHWHCITGFLPEEENPLEQVLIEIYEEAGILPADLDLGCSAVLDLDGVDGTVWRVHAFHFNSRTETITLNWEHDDACWRCIDQVGELQTVPWLSDVLSALEETLPSTNSPQISRNMLRELDLLGKPGIPVFSPSHII